MGEIATSILKQRADAKIKRDQQIAERNERVQKEKEYAIKNTPIVEIDSTTYSFEGKPKTTYNSIDSVHPLGYIVSSSGYQLIKIFKECFYDVSDCKTGIAIDETLLSDIKKIRDAYKDPIKIGFSAPKEFINLELEISDTSVNDDDVVKELENRFGSNKYKLSASDGHFEPSEIWSETLKEKIIWFEK